MNPKGYVPALTLDNGEMLTENVAVLQYIADRNPAAKLAPPAGTMERYRLIEWLAFINSEIHKNFTPLFRKDAPEDVKAYARQNIATRAGWLNSSWGSRSFLMGEQFTVADAYLFVVLGWGQHAGIAAQSMAAVAGLRRTGRRTPAGHRGAQVRGSRQVSLLLPSAQSRFGT